MVKSPRFILVAAIFLGISWSGPQLPAFGSNGSFDSVAGAGREWINLAGVKAGESNAGDGVSRITLAGSSDTALVLKVSLPGMVRTPTEMSDGKMYTSITTPGSGMGEVGRPAVPLFGRWILIPNGTGLSLDIDPGSPLLFKDISVPPVQHPLADLEHTSMQPFARDAGVYNSDQAYPGIFARLEPTKIVRGQECTIIWLYPFQHNPVRKTLAVYPDLSVTVRFHGQPRAISPHLKSKSFEKMFKQMAVNAETVLAAQDLTGEKPSGTELEKASISAQACCNYIIITTNEFLEAANKLAAWKRKIGFQTHVHEYLSPPTAANVKAYLQYWYDTLPVAPQYVLIIGDADDIPCHYETLHPYENMLGGEDTQGYTGTDLYYATLGGSDYMPDISIGRLPVDTASDAMDNVDRIIEYEQVPPILTNFYDKVAICAYFQDGTGLWEPNGIADCRFAQTSEDLAIFFSSPTDGIGKSVNRIYYADPGVTPAKWNDGEHLTLSNFGGGPAGDPGENIPSYLQKPGFPWDGNTADITGAFEDGYFLITHRDHGGRQYWVHPYFHAANMGTLQIRWGEYPVVWSVNCQTGWFDNETDFIKHFVSPNPTGEHEESFAEFLGGYCDMGGPVGIIATTRVTDTIYNDRLMWGWTDAIWPDFIKDYPPLNVLGIRRMGEVLNLGKYYMATTVPDNDWRKCHFEAYHWFGDPAMEIRTEHPDWLSAKIPAVWPFKGVGHDMAIPVEDTQGPLQYATVTISHPDKTYDLWSVMTDPSGNAPFPGLFTTESGTYNVVATAPNCVPFQGSFESFGKEASWCAGHTWWWSDPVLANTYAVDSQKATINVTANQDMWNCSRGQAPMLSFVLPESQSWIAQVKLSVPVLNPDTMAGLALWDGNEQGTVHALYLGLIHQWGWPWVLVGGSTPENCAGTHGFAFFFDTQVYLKIQKSGNTYRFAYKPVGVHGQTWGR